MIVAFVAPTLSAILASHLKKEWQKAFFILSILLGILILYRTYLQPAVYLTDDYFNLEKGDWTKSEAFKNAVIEEGFLPNIVEEAPQENPPKWLIKGKGVVDQKISYNYYKEFTIQANKPLMFASTTHYFPGWKAFIDKQEVTVEPLPGTDKKQICQCPIGPRL